MTATAEELMQLLKSKKHLLKIKGDNEWSVPKVTHQRLAIYNYLKLNNNHPSSEEVYNHIKSEMPTVSRSTVYKTLSMFVDIGVVREMSFGNNQNRYDTNVQLHINIICPVCNGISDYKSSTVDRFWKEINIELDSVSDVPRIDISKKCESCN